MKIFTKRGLCVWVILLISWAGFAQTDTLCNLNDTKKIFGGGYLIYGGVTNSFNEQNRSDITLGQAAVTVKNSLSQNRQVGLGVWMPWLLPPQPPVTIASQGDYKDHVTVSWQKNPLSPAPTGYIVKRDGVFLVELGADILEYIDFNVQAGQFYQYSVTAKNSFGLGSPSTYVGFVNPNGVVSGKMETNSGNPVPGVEVRLTPLTGSSMAFDGVSGQLCANYNNKFPTSAFTISMYVKLGNTNDETGIIDWGSNLNKNWWITTTSSSEGKGYIFHIGNGAGSDTIKYILPVNNSNYLDNDTKWHQITMVYNGSAMSVLVDGNFIASKPASIIREKEKMSIGSKIGGGFFKGLIDDIRIYNRPLGQTEINSSKNRSVSKTDNGLVAYWKMDEGIGQRAFDNITPSVNATLYGDATFSSDKPEVYNSGISDVTGYYTIDGINYAQAESFRATPSKNIDYNSALEFSASNLSYGNLTDFDMPDTATVEIMFYPFDLKSRQTILSKGYLYELYLNNGNLYLNLNGDITDLGTVNTQYHHVAVSMNNTSGTVKIYLDGNLKADKSFSGTSNWANGTPWLIATNSTTISGKFYTGLIDEFAIYKKIMPQDQIQIHAGPGIPQDSTANNLFTYFDFNEGIDNKVYDYAAVNTPLKETRIGTLDKVIWSNNVKNPKTNFHEFQPNLRVVNLNNSNTAVGNVDFKDVSTINVSGYVRFANTICFEDSVEIYSNGSPLFPSVRTDKNGKWSADFEPGVNIRLSAKYSDHTFTPGFMEFRKLLSPKAGIVFLDNTTRIIRGQVAGGQCMKSIIPNGAKVKIKVTATDGCFEKIITLTNPDGNYVIRDLPAKNFTISIIEHSVGNIYNYFQTKGGQTVDLRNAVADTINFIYYAPPQIEIAGITANKCGVKTVGQGVLNKISLKTYEDYFGQKCYVTGSAYHIDDPTSGIVVDTTLADNEVNFTYNFYPKNINIIPPYTQAITIGATVNGANATGTTDFVVLGLKKKGKNFTASTPQMPDFILRDPPGDGSYAILQKGSTICNTKTTSIVNNFSQEASLALSVGGTSVVGLGLAIETTNKLTVSVAGGGSQTWTNTTSRSSCVTTTKTITTSPGDVVVGSEVGGDVYVGRSESVTYGDATMLNLNLDNCSFYTKDQITIDDIRLATDFVYSENYIVNTLMPGLQRLYQDPTNPKRKIDSAAYTTWKKIIYDNKADKSPTKIKTISFDAGATYEESEQMDETIGWTESFDGAGFLQAGIEAEIDFLGGFAAGATLRYEHVKSSSEDREKTNSTVIGYHLEDDDIGDGFLIDLYKGKKYGTYIFKTVAGQSQCPWEKGTKPRAEPAILSKDGNLKTNIPKNTSAVFEIELQNLSPTKEIQTYELQVVTGTNPDGAIIKVDGQPLTQPVSYVINPNSSLKVLVTVDKGPIAFDYRNLQIKLQTTCEYDIAGQIAATGGDFARQLYGEAFYADSLFIRYLTLGVSFIEPCSPIDIGFPLEGWVVTPASQNNLSITLNEYNKNDANLNLVRVQYRPVGGDGSWINIKNIPKDSLGSLFTIFNWKTDLIKDGDYEIRAVAECTDPTKASGISTVIRGKIQRTPPIVLGVPQPSDGTWDPGDEISITFNKDINCDKIIQADVLSNNTIGLYDATTNKLVDATITCLGNKLTLVPNISPKFFENRTFRVVVTGKDDDDANLLRNPNYQAVGIRDKFGNPMEKTLKWEFYVNQNALEWVGADIHEANIVNQPFTVKRQIRNRGGSIMAFRMESVPAWYTVSPAIGTLNPGQVADVTITFQQDLLIGDYLDTLQLAGSQGTEPLLIDYKVRCASPNWVVLNPEQYEAMNMVVSLNIFGEDSKDPSDKIVAKIDGQIRGVANVAYYPIVKKWLAFITIYGTPDDAGKNIEFNVWKGNKCNTYAEVLEQVTFDSGSLLGSPIEPQSMTVVNLISKKIALNKGWNWLSFNLDLGTGNNTVSKVLSSLKYKNGALIKDDALFSKYYPEPINDWKNSLKTINPIKRYMVYAPEKDTISIKGMPYKATDFPVNIVQGWNWIGYVPSSGISVTQGLRGLTPLNGDIIKSQTAFAQYVAGLGWVGNLNFLEPSKGYLLKISNTGNLTYPEPTTSTAFSADFESATIALANAKPEVPIDYQFAQYQSNMNIIGRVEGITIDPDDELRAYIDGKLAGLNKSIINKKDRLFFQTVYHQDALNVSFKLYKADRKKEYDLSNVMTFKVDSLAGLVTNPVIFKLVSNANSPVTVSLNDQLISQPNIVFEPTSIKSGVSPQDANCTTYTFNSILPSGTDVAPTCTAVTGLEGNMIGVIKPKYNERSTFITSGDVISFINPANNTVVGCGSFDADFNVFNYTVKGGTSSTEIPIDVKYFSSAMQKTFTLKSAFTYKNNKELGDYNTPLTLDFSPLSISSDAAGIITTVMRDTSWTGKYCVQAFAMNCSGYSDGQTTVCFERLKAGDCVAVIARSVAESNDTVVQALSITSQATINSNVQIQYKGGNVIELKPGFDTKPDTFFIGNIEGCKNK